MPWLILAIGVALVGQKVGGLFLSPTHSGAVGACLVVPFAMLGARIKTFPPAIVMMLAAFWALVPGALSFEELGRAAAGAGDISTLGVAVAAIFSIALGTLIGWSVFATINTSPGAEVGLGADDCPECPSTKVELMVRSRPMTKV